MKNQNKKLGKVLAAAIFGVGFVTPLMFGSIAEAGNYGAGGVVALYSPAHLSTYAATNSHSVFVGTTSNDDSIWHSNIDDSNCVMINGYRFKVVKTETPSSGEYAGKQILTLWSYNSTETGASKSFSKSAYEADIDWSDGHTITSAEAYNNSDLKTAVDGLLEYDSETGKPNGGELYDSKLTYVKYTSTGLTNKKNVDNWNDPYLPFYPNYSYLTPEGTSEANVSNAYVWVPSQTEVDSIEWGGGTALTDANRAIGSNSWLRSSTLFSNCAQMLMCTGYTASTVANSHFILRPALQILNQTSAVFTTNITIPMDGVFKADDSAGTNYAPYVLNSSVTAIFEPTTGSGVTLDGTKIGITALTSDATNYKVAGLLTEVTSGIDTWANLNGTTANIAYMAQVNSGKLDLTNVVVGTDYNLKLFGLKTADTTVTELASGSITGLRKGSDGKIHMKIGGTHNNGVSVTLKGGAVIDLVGDASNAITVSAKGEGTNTGEGKLNMGANNFTGKITNGGILTVDATIGSLTPGISSSNSGTLELKGGTLAGAIANTGTVKLNGATLGGKHVTTGTLEFAANTSTNADYVAATTNKVDSGVTLELTGGRLTKAVTNAGTVKLTGAELEASVTDGILEFALKSGEQTTLYTVLSDYVAGVTNLVDAGVTLTLKKGNFDKTITNSGLVKLDGVTLGENANITGDVEIVGSNEVKDAKVLNKLNDVKIQQDATLTLSGGTLTNNVIGDGTLVIAENATVVYEPAKESNKINTEVIVEQHANLDPVADVFVENVHNRGTLVLEGGNLAAPVTNYSTGTLEITAPVTMTGGSIAFESGSNFYVALKNEDGSNPYYYAASEAAIAKNKAIIQNVTSGNVNIVDGAKIRLNGTAENGGYYVLLGGDGVNIMSVWNEDDIIYTDEAITAIQLVKANNSLAILTFKITKAEENINCIAGVQQGMLSVNNQVADALADHLGLAGKGREEGKYKQDVWASYIRNKDDVNGMATSSNQGSFGSDYRAKVNGVTVGADIFTTEKAIGGIAINYATGDTDGTGERTGSILAQVNNKTKYYGVELYNRITNNHHAILMDIGYMHGKNEISVTEAKSWIADADVNTITAGVRWERDFNLKGSKLVPFAGVRYIRLQSKDFTNTNGLAYSTNSQNLFQPKVGLTWIGNFKMAESDWTFKPRAEVGYLWALGNREAETNAVINKYFVTNKFDVTDKSSYYAKLGMDFSCKNFTAGVGYSYMKGNAVRSNRWNVNLSWNF